MIENSLNRSPLLAVMVLGAGCIVMPGLLRAQAPAGPLPPAQTSDAPPPPAAKPLPTKPALPPRTSVMGAWKLNRDDSDDARKKMQEAQSNGGYGGNRRMGGGYARDFTIRLRPSPRINARRGFCFAYKFSPTVKTLS